MIIKKMSTIKIPQKTPVMTKLVGQDGHNGDDNDSYHSSINENTKRIERTVITEILLPLGTLMVVTMATMVTMEVAMMEIITEDDNSYARRTPIITTTHKALKIYMKQEVSLITLTGPHVYLFYNKLRHLSSKYGILLKLLHKLTRTEPIRPTQQTKNPLHAAHVEGFCYSAM